MHNHTPPHSLPTSSSTTMIGFALFTLLSAVQAHMQLFSPAPFNATNNPNTVGAADHELNFPHNCCGKTTPMPCRGYLNLLGTPEGAPTASWAAGSAQSWSIWGGDPSTNVAAGGNHFGGSCQVGFSTDGGKSFHVTQSYEGNCPHRNGGETPNTQTFPFTVPSDLPTGEAVFAWTWFNREQEFFMNCAAVTITGGSGAAPAVSSGSTQAPSSSPAPSSSASKPASSSVPASPNTYKVGDCTCTCSSTTNGQKLKTKRDFTMSGCSCTCSSTPVPAPAERRAVPGRSPLRPRILEERYSNTPFSQRPLMLFANVNNGCTTPKTTAEVQYPNPGPDVTMGDGGYPLELPSGSCG
jgi:hypothetical protein